MKQIQDARTTNVSVGALALFFSNVNTGIKATGAEALHLTELAPKFDAQVAQLFSVINKQSALDANITTKAADESRDGILNFMDKLLRAMTKSPIAAEAEAAARLMNVMNSYPNLAEVERQKETALINGLVTDLTAKEEDVTAVKAADYVSLLAQANAQYEVAASQRNVEAYAREQEGGGKVASELRNEVAETYRDIVTVVNAYAIVQPSEAIDGFIDHVNAEILQLQNVIATEQAARTRKANAKKKEENSKDESGEMTDESGAPETPENAEN